MAIVLFFVSMLVVGAAINVVTHEMGHVLAARVARMEIVGIHMGPLGWQRVDGRWRPRCVPLWEWLRGVRGAVQAAPTPAMRHPWRSWILVSLGGPLADLAVACVAPMLGALLWSAGPVTATRLVAIYAYWTGVVAVLTLLLTALATPMPPHETDGQHLRRLLRRPRAVAERDAALETVHAAMHYRLAPEEWPRAWIEMATGLADGSAEEARACHLAYYGCMDSDEKRALIGRAVAVSGALPSDERRSVLVSAALAVAAAGQAPSLARQYLAAAGEGGECHDVRYRYAEAFVLWAEGDKDAALSLARDEARRLSELGRPLSPTEGAIAKALQARLEEGEGGPSPAPADA